MTEPVIKRALISVSDKTGLVEFARALAARNIEIISTGGTARGLREAGIPVLEVSNHTGFPEILGGRVKTLHPMIHGGILARRSVPEDLEALDRHAIPAIDLVVVNLYPFAETVASGADMDTCIEQIDIGGPALIRAAAKNHPSVTIVTLPEQYEKVLAALDSNDGATTVGLRRALAATAYAHTAAYDSAIAEWMTEWQAEADPAGAPQFPPVLTISGQRAQVLRYGENPHQKAAVYVTDRRGASVATATQLQGKELSYNNLNDTDAAFDLVSEFGAPAVVIVKHANPSGVAVAESSRDAYSRALACDPVSAFGGIIALNRPLEGATAEEIAKLFAEVIIAPTVTAEAKAALARKSNLRVLETGGMPDARAGGMTMKTLGGALLVQSRDNGTPDPSALRCVTKRQPSEAETRDLLFAFTVCKHVKSNAIVYAKDRATVGIGAGQMSRVDSSRIAAQKAANMASEAGETETRTMGSVVASDAFFPFADGLITAAEAGVTAVIQPGGSQRDAEVIAAADERNLAMLMTGIRHFRH